MAVPLMCTVLFVCTGARAQDRAEGNEASAQPYSQSASFEDGSGWAVAGQFGYDIPLGKLSLNYRQTPTYGISVIKSFDGFSASFSINHHAYPIKNIAYGQDKDKFVVLGAYFGVTKDFLISPAFKAYGGLNLGGWIKHYESLWEYQDDGDGYDYSESNFYTAPKVGFTYLTNSRIGFGLEAKYNIFVTGYDYIDGTDGGQLYNSFAATVILSYHF